MARSKKMAVKNPFREAEKALNPTTSTTSKPKPKTLSTSDLTKGGTSREAAVRAALRKQAAAKTKQRSSTNKGRSR